MKPLEGAFELLLGDLRPGSEEVGLGMADGGGGGSFGNTVG
jgi:hypothetical protein